MQAPPSTTAEPLGAAHQRTLLVCGASVRAAAQSARRAGLAVVAADLFADLDLAASCPVARIDDYPLGLLAAAQSAPPGPWCYTGALENHPQLVDRISRHRPLWGNAGTVLRRVRDPWQLQAALRGWGLPTAQLRPAAGRLPPPREAWLWKPFASAGGAGIEPLRGGPPRDAGEWYLQQRLAGRRLSAVWVAAGRQARLLGVTRQLTGLRAAGLRTGASVERADAPFRYVGSIGPWPVTHPQRARLQAIGACLADRFELAGLFGADLIDAPQGLTVVEVNPRYPASAEVLERALGFSAIGLHARACAAGGPEQLRSSDAPPLPAAGTPEPEPAVCGKLVLYARWPFAVSERFAERACGARRIAGWPAWADIPHPGQTIPAGHPIATLLADGRSPADVLRRLRSVARPLVSRSR